MPFRKKKPLRSEGRNEYSLSTQNNTHRLLLGEVDGWRNRLASFSGKHEPRDSVAETPDLRADGLLSVSFVFGVPLLMFCVQFAKFALSALCFLLQWMLD